MKFIKILTVAAVAVGLFVVTAAAQQITNFNFDSVPLGNTPPTTAPLVDTYPQQNVYAIDGFPDTGPYAGTVTVQDVGGMNHAAVMTTTQGGTGSQYMDTQFLAAAPFFDISFDLNVLDVPTNGLPQNTGPLGGAPDGQAFVLQAFGLDTQRVFRFAASPTSATGGNFGFRLPEASGDLTTFGTYIEGQTYHLEFQIDFTTGTADILVDNALALNDAPLVNPGAGFSELFIFQNGVEGLTNSVAIDNIVTTAVPEPATWFGAAMASVMLGTFRLRSARRRAS
jgi:hypothetical protein